MAARREILGQVTRPRAWRRSINRTKARKDFEGLPTVRPERNWKHMYLRSEKLSRAKQLGFDYPRKRGRQVLDEYAPIEPEE